MQACLLDMFMNTIVVLLGEEQMLDSSVLSVGDWNMGAEQCRYEDR